MTVATLEGRLRDQTELSGVLNSLYELHLPILSIENLAENNGVCEERQDLDESAQSGAGGAESTR